MLRTALVFSMILSDLDIREKLRKQIERNSPNLFEMMKNVTKDNIGNIRKKIGTEWNL